MMERKSSKAWLSTFGTVAWDDTLIILDRNDLVERLSSGSDGIRQDFIIQKKLAGNGNLSLSLSVRNAVAEGAGEAVRLRIPSGRSFIYYRVLATDASGIPLPALMTVRGKKIVIEVNDRNAKYPVFIDPTISDEDWIVCNKNGIRGINGSISDMVYFKDSLYIGGKFNLAGTQPVNNIAFWNGSAWICPGNGVNGPVSDMECDSTGNLYVAGNFDKAGDVPVKNIAKWDGTKWDSCGPGLNKIVQALACDGRLLYACGNFDSAGNSNISKLAIWDGSQWKAIDTGPLPNFSCIAADKAGNFYVGGSFDTLNGVVVHCVAKWSENAWHSLGVGMTYGSGANPTHPYVSKLCCSRDGTLFAGGFFYNAGNVFVQHVASWNGTAWRAFRGGVAWPVSKMACTESGILFIDQQSKIFNVNGSPTIVDTGLNPSCLATDRFGCLYIASSRRDLNNSNSNFVFRRSGSFCDTIDVNRYAGFVVSAITFDKKGNLYIAETPSTQSLNVPMAYQFKKWNGDKWTTICDGIKGEVFALAVDTGGSLYVGGKFQNAGTIQCQGIARWDGSKWDSLGRGMNASPYSYSINALIIDGMGNLYAGGLFSTPAQNIARWDGKNWSALGLGLNSTCRSLSLDRDGNLFAGGAFYTAGGVAAKGVAKWDGSSWSSLGNGIPGLTNAYADIYHGVKSIACDNNGNVYVSGDFDTTGHIYHTLNQRVAKWDGIGWSSLHTSESGNEINSIRCDFGGNLYVAGNFDAIGAVKAKSIARWNGAEWSSLGSGTSSTINAIDVCDSILCAAGSFIYAGSKVSPYIATVNIHRDIVGAFSNPSMIKLPSIRYFLSGRKLTVFGADKTDRISLYSISGRIIGTLNNSSVIILNGIYSQPVLINVKRNGSVISRGMALVR